ncbi:hypothetical protein CRG98_006131 [Punica granatum]|uniref:Uncharacterized protein n=1 Tax=Punica granatum TaxID=22663 RepID=A0A2I0KZ04_PUNGR|nr:hypothetical protein CRG98_006131 [Punica granatum]
MLGFAERLGWRIQKHDEAAVEQFCSETGVRRQNNCHACLQTFTVMEVICNLQIVYIEEAFAVLLGNLFSGNLHVRLAVRNNYD